MAHIKLKYGAGEQLITYEELESKRIDFWDEDNISLSLFPYKPIRSAYEDAPSHFLRSFKRSDQDAVPMAGAHVCQSLVPFVDEWRERFNIKIIVPVPSHTAYRVAPSSKDICRLVARVFKLSYSENLLFRTETVIPAHMSYFGRRLSMPEHFQTLACKTNADLEGAGIVLFDDLRTTGHTSQACKRRLRERNCGEVVRLFLGRTL